MGTDSWASSDVVRKSMKGNRSRDTGPELRVRRLVHARGMRYLVDAPPERSLRRRADLLFRGPRVAVFIDGCFWHGCPNHHTVSRTNSDFWADKVAKNRARDVDTNERLAAHGWTVLRFWEHEDPHAVAAAIELSVKGARSAG
jgi:DNA mismatch endonuclease (patch repair protein)